MRSAALQACLAIAWTALTEIGGVFEPHLQDPLADVNYWFLVFAAIH